MLTNINNSQIVSMESMFDVAVSEGFDHKEEIFSDYEQI